MPIESAKPLSRTQVAELKDSFKLLDTAKVSELFYKTLFGRYPKLRPLFPASMTDQAAKLMSVFELVIYSFEEKSYDSYSLQEEVIKPLRDLGRRHQAKGVKSEYYPIVNSLILEVFEDLYPHAMTESVKDSWNLALEHLTFAMLNNSGGLKGSKGTKGSIGELFTKIKKRIIDN